MLKIRMAQEDGDVLVVTGDREFGGSVVDLLSRVSGRIREAASGEDGLALAERQRPDCVVLDVILPGMTGYAVCQDLRHLYGDDVSIILVSGERTEPADRVAGLLLGADDYVAKPFDPDEFTARVRRGLARARRSVPQEINAAAALGELTVREREVLTLLAEGRDQSTIANELFISPTTVSTHIQRILSKLGVHSRAQAVAVAHLERLVDMTAPHEEEPVWAQMSADQAHHLAVTAPRNGRDSGTGRAVGESVSFEILPNSRRSAQNNRSSALPEEAVGLAPPSTSTMVPARAEVAGLNAPSNGTSRSEEKPTEGLLGEAAWWLDPATLRARVSMATGELTYITPQSIGSTPSEEAIGRHFMDFVLPEARADASSLFDRVRQAGEIHAQGQLRRSDGSTFPIEIRGVANGESIEVAYRPVGPDELSRSTISGMEGSSEPFGRPAATVVAE